MDLAVPLPTASQAIIVTLSDENITQTMNHLVMFWTCKRAQDYPNDSWTETSN